MVWKIVHARMEPNQVCKDQFFRMVYETSPTKSSDHPPGLTATFSPPGLDANGNKTPPNETLVPGKRTFVVQGGSSSASASVVVLDDLFGEWQKVKDLPPLPEPVIEVGTGSSAGFWFKKVWSWDPQPDKELVAGCGETVQTSWEVGITGIATGSLRREVQTWLANLAGSLGFSIEVGQTYEVQATLSSDPGPPVKAVKRRYYVPRLDTYYSETVGGVGGWIHTRSIKHKDGKDYIEYKKCCGN